MWFCEWIIRSKLLDNKNKININPHQPKESHHLTRCLASLNLRSSTNFTKDLFASLAPGTRRSWLVVVVVRRSSPLEPGWKTSNNPLKLAFNVLLLLLLHICQPGKGNILQRKTQVCEENLACEPTWLIKVAWGGRTTRVLEWYAQNPLNWEHAANKHHEQRFQIELAAIESESIKRLWLYTPSSSRHRAYVFVGLGCEIHLRRDFLAGTHEEGCWLLFLNLFRTAKKWFNLQGLFAVGCCKLNKVLICNFSLR